jgi:hypothetical protein
MKTYRVRVQHRGYEFITTFQVNELDEVYECVEWKFPGARIIGADAIQRIA